MVIFKRAQYSIFMQFSSHFTIKANYLGHRVQPASAFHTWLCHKGSTFQGKPLSKRSCECICSLYNLQVWNINFTECYQDDNLGEVKFWIRKPAHVSFRLHLSARKTEHYRIAFFIPQINLYVSGNVSKLFQNYKTCTEFNITRYTFFSTTFMKERLETPNTPP